MLADEVAACAARRGDDAVAVGDGDRRASRFAQRFAKLRGKLVHAAHKGIFFENDLSVLARVDLQRVAAADNTDTENLVLVVFGGLDQRVFDIFRAKLKICGVLRERASLEQAVDVRLELHLDVILIDPDFFDHQIQVVAVKRRLFQNVVKYIHCRFRHAVDADDGVSFVAGKFDLVLNACNALRQLRFQLVVSFI